MTTVAFKDGIMAADSQASDGEDFFCRITKIHRLHNGALVGQSGDCDVRDVLAVLEKATPRKMPTREALWNTKTSFSGIVAFPGGKLYTVDIGRAKADEGEWCAQVIECKERMTAVGSGAKYVLGAMAAGRSAKQAVQIACRFDGYSNGPVIEVAVRRTRKV